MPCGILTLTDALFQETYICAPVGNASPDYNSRPNGPDFHPELIPVHSPLLRESCLVSFPPLTYMLKFSGFADLTSCLESQFSGNRKMCRGICFTHDGQRAKNTYSCTPSQGRVRQSMIFVAEIPPGKPHEFHVSKANSQPTNRPREAL